MRGAVGIKRRTGSMDESQAHFAGQAEFLQVYLFIYFPVICKAGQIELLSVDYKVG